MREGFAVGMVRGMRVPGFEVGNLKEGGKGGFANVGSKTCSKYSVNM